MAVTALEEINPPFDTFLQQSPNTPNLIVTNPIKNLRTIPLKLEGTVNVDAILDEGSQIIGIRRDVWEKLGVPLRSDQSIVMESANATHERSIGLIRNLQVNIGNLTLYVQAQVVENASYKMLLGQPFLTLTQANTHHFPDGGSHITLADPNSQSVITIPTKPCICPTSKPQGFQ
ncbi:hypothetical protein P691DRAFT_767201 [Macrolepiota fuliginosa MF-IS2]|uniref:Peptidase A2 domain-containing protein n=1 Tax=Macrolepiota fuliginosa MF-IS2 TaxID=1400762 RepID=A0A9P5X0S5_9AGAR|nr:hypothetical protein P691DRAFT_767201 [Macrolepiota fuliginosa MF-IS2]